MKILINPFYFGIEFNKTTIREDILGISRELSAFLAEKNYSSKVNYIQIILFCNFPFVQPHRRPKYVGDSMGRVVTTGDTFPIYHELYVDIIIENFDELIAAKGPEVASIIGREVIAYFEKVELPMKIRKSFDKVRFVDDLREFFNIPESQKITGDGSRYHFSSE